MKKKAEKKISTKIGRKKWSVKRKISKKGLWIIVDIAIPKLDSKN